MAESTEKSTKERDLFCAICVQHTYNEVNAKPAHLDLDLDLVADLVFKWFELFFWRRAGLGNAHRAGWSKRMRRVGHGRIRCASPNLADCEEKQAFTEECFWKRYPEGSCFGVTPGDPKIDMPVQPKTDLEPLREWVRTMLATVPKRWKSLLEDLREVDWLHKQLNAIIRKMRREHELAGSDYSSTFNPSNDPLLRMLPRQLELFS